MCRILSTLTTSFPFLFLCLAIAILFHLHLISHIISNTFYILYSPLISLPWSAAGCYALCSLCSSPSLGESLEFSLWIPLARIWVLYLIVRLPLHFPAPMKPKIITMPGHCSLTECHLIVNVHSQKSYDIRQTSFWCCVWPWEAHWSQLNS